jgi:PAS domain S-box-containing protein
MNQPPINNDELQLLRAVLANTVQGVNLVKVADSTIVYTNPIFDSMFGYEKGELTGQHVSILNAAADRTSQEKADEILSELRKTGTWSGEIENRKKDGSTFWCSARASSYMHPTHGEVWVSIQSDITARKKMEEELKESRRFLSDLIEHSGATIFAKDIYGRYELVNKKWEEVTGLRRQEVMGKTSAELFPGPTGKKLLQNDLQVLSLKTVLETEEIIDTISGTRIFHAIKFPLLDEHGKISGLCGITTEVTDKKKMEEELVAHRKNLTDLVEERTKELKTKTQFLEELNTTLKVMLRQREEDRKELEERFVANIKNMILPYTEKLKTSGLKSVQISYLNIVESHLSEIMSPLMKNLYQFNLTHTEIQVASLVKDGKTTKEMANIMGIATSSIDTHRKRIRKKLGLSREINLRSYIKSLTI